MANGIADYLNVSQQDLLGSAAPNMPMANTMMPGYDQEMNIDEKIKDTIKNNKEKVREFMQDPEVVNSIKDVIFGDVQNEE